MTSALAIFGTGTYAAASDVWRWQPHPEVWLLLVGAVGLAWYTTRVIAPKVVPAGQPVVSTLNTRSFVLAMVFLWVAADWPLHDIAEEYLYFMHMVQHLLITFIVPPLLLMAVPEWLGRLVVSETGSVGVWIRRLSRPVAAGFLFNFAAAVTHLKVVVNTSVENGPFHYLVHVFVFATALLMWVPVLSPLPELRASRPGQMIYLFMMSILPTIPAAFLTFARNPLYEAYDHPVRLWGINVVQDQQAAGVVMKLGGGIFLWTIIAILFFRWTSAETATARTMRRVDADGNITIEAADGSAIDVTDDDILTWEAVQEAFDSTEPAPSEPH